MLRNLTLLALAALVSAPAMAQSQDVPGDERAGTAGAQYLLVPTTARTAALGNSLTGGLADLSGIEAVQSNPAALMTNEGTNAQFSRMEYVADIGINTFGVAQRFGNNNVALSVTNWDIGDIPRTDAGSSDPSSLTYNAGFTIVGASYARSFTDRISAGVTVKLASEQIDDMNGGAVAFDAGMTYTVGESGLRFGVSLKNFGTKVSYGGNGLRQFVNLDPNDETGFPTLVDAESYELPSLLNFGASYTQSFAGDLSVAAMGNFRSNSYDQPEFAGGLEVGYANLIHARAGVNIVPEPDQTAWEMWSVGAGLNVPVSNSAIGVDYTYRQMEFFNEVHMFSVGLGF